MRITTDAIAAEFRRYKALAEGAFAQLDDAALTARLAPDGNSIAILVWHISGNLRSRFSDFLTSDGEKPWRDRDEEFVERRVTKEELLKFDGRPLFPERRARTVKYHLSEREAALYTAYNAGAQS